METSKKNNPVEVQGNSSALEDDFFGSSGDDFFDSTDEPESELLGSLGKPGLGGIMLSVLYGILFCIVFSVIVGSIYMRYIKYPDREEIKYEESGLYCLENWVSDISELKGGEYISKEVEYANGNEDRVAFYKNILSTVGYTPGKTTVKNVYGNDYINKETGEVEYMDSLVSEGEEVTLSYVDYTKIEFDEDIVKDLMDEANLRVGDADYSNLLINVFCRYINQLSTLPTKSVKYVPNIEKSGNAYEVLPEEDIYLDNLLFSSEEFKDAVYRFSLEAGKVTGGKKLKNFQPTKEWKKWKKLSKSKRKNKEEPAKYSGKQLCSTSWCGTYNLINNESIKTPELGNGTLENPASVGTGILTNWLVKENGKVEKYPIKVKLVEFGVSEDAIEWFESKDERNRGIDITSEAQYCYYVFEVTNLSSKALTIKDNSSLSDSSANLSSRTGTLYGIQSKVKINPDETGIIESWSRSTELNKKYVVWGKNFERREEPVWFRVLAGDLEDPSENKGVRINDTRVKSGITEDESDTESDGEYSEESYEDDSGYPEESEDEDTSSEEEDSEVQSGYIE